MYVTKHDSSNQTKFQAEFKVHVYVQLRRFVGFLSRGLRVRMFPSLQCQDLGLVTPGGVLTAVEEVNFTFCIYDRQRDRHESLCVSS
jgi:hypothetical protein